MIIWPGLTSDSAPCTRLGCAAWGTVTGLGSALKAQAAAQPELPGRRLAAMGCATRFREDRRVPGDRASWPCNVPSRPPHLNV